MTDDEWIALRVRDAEWQRWAARRVARRGRLRRLRAVLAAARRQGLRLVPGTPARRGS